MNPIGVALFGVGGTWLAYQVGKQLYMDWKEVQRSIGVGLAQKEKEVSNDGSKTN